MMLVITTQLQENYGAHDWDGEGACPQHWKMKGGSEYKILGIPADCDPDEIAEIVRTEIEENNDHFRVTIVGYGLEADDYLSWFEKSQLEYDGVIACKEPVIDYSDLVEAV